MLKLVRDISHGKGINVLVSSHLLPDIERTCDEVIVMRSGKVARQGLVKDLRSKLALGNPDRVLDGDLEPLMHAYLVWRKTGKIAGDDKDEAGE